MEPTIYKPSIYKGTGIYKTGAEGGDYESKVNIGNRDYKVIRINDKLWLAENLDYKFTGLEIGGAWDVTTPKAWYYNNDEDIYGIDGYYKCGLLYNWYAAKYLDENKNTLLPNGWRVATNSDWLDMINYVGNMNTPSILKAKDRSITPVWPSGFNGTIAPYLKVLPAGDYTNGIFGYLGTNTAFHTTDEYSATTNYIIAIAYAPPIENYHYTKKTNGYSLRLVKDA